MNSPLQIFFNKINHGYRAAILQKNVLWLVPFYMVVATYFYYEKVSRTMRTAIVSNLLNRNLRKRKAMYFFSNFTLQDYWVTGDPWTLLGYFFRSIMVKNENLFLATWIKFIFWVNMKSENDINQLENNAANEQIK